MAKESSSSFYETIAYEFTVRNSGAGLWSVISDGSHTGSYGNYIGASLKDSIWRHVATTWAPDDIRLYIDGVQVFQGNLLDPIYTINNTTDSILIGSFRWNTWGGYRKMTGDMDEVRIYNRALSEDEIEELAFGPSQVDVDIDIKPGSCLPKIPGHKIKWIKPEHMDGGQSEHTNGHCPNNSSFLPEQMDDLLEENRRGKEITPEPLPSETQAPAEKRDPDQQANARQLNSNNFRIHRLRQTPELTAAERDQRRQVQKRAILAAGVVKKS